MTLTLGDRAFETSGTQGTGTINLAGPVTGFKSFVAVAGTGKTVPYIMDDGTNWETGYGVITAGSPDTLTRNPRKSSNANAAVNWGPGTRNVRLGLPADFTLCRDENMNFIEGFGTGGGTANAQTVTLPVAPLAYSDGMEITYFAGVANTGAMTLNVNGLGAKTVKILGLDVPAGLIKAGTLVRGIYRASSGFIELSTPFLNYGVAGNVVFHLGTAAPAGTLQLNGATGLSRTAYADLFASLSASSLIVTEGTKQAHEFGNGDGSTTFSLGDWRGYYPRFWDNGRGIDTGRALGSYQADAFQGHRFNVGSGLGGTVSSGANFAGNATTPSSDPISDGTNGTPRTAAETRVKSIALMACIRY